MKIEFNTKLTLKSGDRIVRSTAMKDYSTGELFWIGRTDTTFLAKLIKFTKADILLPHLERTVFGVGWIKEFNDQLSALGLSEELEKAINSEANIARNRRGGVASHYYYDVANRVIDDLNAGREPRFENVEWNEQFKKAHAARLRRGLTEAELNV
jgi:hypothetical protein